MFYERLSPLIDQRHTVIVPDPESDAVFALGDGGEAEGVDGVEGGEEVFGGVAFDC